MAFDPGPLIRLLVEGGVDFVIAGGVAGTMHGSARLTHDLDIVYGRSPRNLQRIAEVLAPLRPYLRGAPPGLPFLWDARTLERGLNFTLTTTLGDLDLLGEITGGGRFEDVKARTTVFRLGDIEFPCLDLDTLIRTKRAAGRPKDLEAIAELEAIDEEARARAEREGE